jgi:hypothetical protein
MRCNLHHSRMSQTSQSASQDTAVPTDAAGQLSNRARAILAQVERDLSADASPSASVQALALAESIGTLGTPEPEAGQARDPTPTSEIGPPELSRADAPAPAAPERSSSSSLAQNVDLRELVETAGLMAVRTCEQLGELGEVLDELARRLGPPPPA